CSYTLSLSQRMSPAGPYPHLPVQEGIGPVPRLGSEAVLAVEDVSLEVVRLSVERIDAPDLVHDPRQVLRAWKDRGLERAGDDERAGRDQSQELVEIERGVLDAAFEVAEPWHQRRAPVPAVEAGVGAEAGEAAAFDAQGQARLQQHREDRAVGAVGVA